MRKKLPFQSFMPLVALKSFVRVSALCIVLICTGTMTFGQAQLLKDINTLEQLSEGEYHHLTPASGIMYFASFGGLWKTTGTPGGTIKLKSFNSIWQMIPVGSAAYFFADDGVHGFELWKTAGTAASTVLVKDITPGSMGTEITSLTNVNGVVFFVAKTSLGKELWKTDGTAAGTVMVKDILKSSGSSNPTDLVNMNGTLYFSANDGTNGYELWKSNGTAAGTVMVKDIRPELKVSSSPQSLTVINNTIYFTAIRPETGRELWKTDGTEAGTVLVKDIYAGTGSSAALNLTNVNGTLFFSATDGIHGLELWKSNGTVAGTVLVKDMTPGSAGSNGTGYVPEPMGHFKAIGNMLYYLANKGDNLLLWRSDGTEAGTIVIQDYDRIGFNQAMPAISNISNKAFYFNSSYVGDSPSHDLWRIDPGSTTPVLVKQFPFNVDEYDFNLQQEMVTFNNTLFFNAAENGGYKLFKSTGTTEGTTVLKDTHSGTQGSYPNPFATANNYTFFSAGNEHGHDEIWRTDGTEAGTIKLHEHGYFEILASSESTVYFLDYENGYNLWKSDGTPAGTVLVKEGVNGYTIISSIVVDDVLYFCSLYGELWRSDGTEAGTYELIYRQNITDLHAAGDELYFQVRYGNTQELWKTDGTVAGTTLIKTIPFNETVYPWARERSAYLNGIVYFLATDVTHSLEVWRSDGTEAGTYMFADLNTLDNNTMGSYDFDIASMHVFNNTLYISAVDNSGVWGLYSTNGVAAPVRITDLFPVSNMVPAGDKLYLFATNSHTYPQAITQTLNLWVTDGTAAGTTQLSNVDLRQDIDYEMVGDVLYYASTINGSNTGSLYRSDGTSCGTYEVNTGVTGATPLESLNGILVFSANAPFKGVEPHIYNTTLDPGSPCADTFAASSTQNDEGSMSGFPNPFMSDFALHIKSDKEEAVEVKVYTANGYPVETLGHLRTNASHTLGASWPPGVYIVKVVQDGTLTNYRVVKK